MFDELVAEIEAEYHRLGHTLGWRFVTSPRRTVSPKTHIVFLGLNPGGKQDRPDHPSASSEAGSAYVVESWGEGVEPGQDGLQQQVQALYEYLSVEPDDVLSGQLVPFRSPSWDELPAKEESLRLGINVWRRVLDYVKPSMIIAMGKTVLRPSLHEILGAPEATEVIPVAWGNITATADTYSDCRLVSLPHLSRFGIMTREVSRPAIEELLCLR